MALQEIALYGMALCAMMLHGVAWCGCGMALYDIALHYMTWLGMVLHCVDLRCMVLHGVD